MYWGSDDYVRPGVGRRQPRLRRLLTIAVVGILSVAGTVVMASAATPHPATAASVATQTAGPIDQLTASVSTTHGHGGAFHTSVFTAKPAVPKPAVAKPAVAKPAATATHAGGAAESEQHAVQTALQTRSQTPAATGLASTGGCGAAINYLSANSAPGFQFECPGYALGHQAMTCVNVAGVCPGIRLIVIADACPAAYMNEAHNSWIVAGIRSGSIDPYGYCH